MRDLFGHGAPAERSPRPRRSAKPTTAATAKASVKSRGSAPAFTAEQPPAGRAIDSATVESFCALGAAVCLESPAGIVWLVPSYTAEPRPELSAHDLAKLVMTCTTFPGSRIASFESPHSNPASGPTEAQLPDTRRHQ